jgi:uncharacterized protein (DUF1810 family)
MMPMDLCRSYIPARPLGETRGAPWEQRRAWATIGGVNQTGLDRFRTAQRSPEAGFEAALREIRGGQKTGHWIWYILPQLSGLGMSSMSRAFALRDPAEAADYLNDPELGARLLDIVTAVADQLATRPDVPVAALMGSDVDARKLVSSLTLFEHVARGMDRASNSERARRLAEVSRRVLAVAAAEGYEPCRFTRDRLARGGVVPDSP